MNVILENLTILHNFDWTDGVCPLCLALMLNGGKKLVISNLVWNSMVEVKGQKHEDGLS